MTIQLGIFVRDKITGFTGITDNRATFMYGCDRYCVIAQVGEDGKYPETAMIDEPQLEIIPGKEQVMKPIGNPEKLVEMGQWVKDPIKGIEGTVIGRAVYLNGCSRVLVQPKQVGNKDVEAYWVNEKQIEGQNTFIGKKKIIKEPDFTSSRSWGGPAPKNSKY